MTRPRIGSRSTLPFTASVIAAALAILGAVAIGEAQALPVPPWARSVRVVRDGVTVRARPDRASARRGTVQRGSRLPLIARVRGEGCPGGEWFQIGPEAFVCESLVRYSPEPAGGDRLPRMRPGALTPRDHAFVAASGTWAYLRPSDYFEGSTWAEAFGAGFGLAIIDRREVSGVEMARTLGGLWVPASQLRFARPSEFEGVTLESADDLERVGWIIRPNAIARAEPGRGPIRDRLPRLSALRIEEERRGWLRVDEDRWVQARDVARPQRADRPEEAGRTERWIDVHRPSQTLVAYVGDTPVFATLVSTGRAQTPTPAGTFRIWVKLAEDDMNDLERDDVEQNYHIQAVPWVQYFEGSYGLHAAFWHEAFGRPRSHGCVNLAPKDAARLFDFTQPALAAGWDAILPTSRAPGTIVHVR